MYFDIYKSDKPLAEPYWWVAKGDNGERLCASEMLSSKQACKNAIRRVKGDAGTANVYDETREVPAATRISI